ncbi:response regulator [Rhizobium hidalgonense]|uniref:response regulator n=1 Tax=Rhizobium hidalgonense TaxID=1538159 RepID=UPI0011066035|nr:response regulator [Rhizobium hidalgonense]QKK26854.1 response regulator [Rhizobium hidalgonense]
MTSFGPPTKSTDDPITGSAGSAKQEGGTGKPARILIVEDEYFIALEIENRLVDAGFEVVGIALTADEAISIATSSGPDLAVMDIRLAGRGDGVQAAIELFTRLGIRSIFASAHADAQTRERASGALPIGWLQKPYSAEALIKLIRQHLS